jgi:hypothetical protein
MPLSLWPRQPRDRSDQQLEIVEGRCGAHLAFVRALVESGGEMRGDVPQVIAAAALGGVQERLLVALYDQISQLVATHHARLLDRVVMEAQGHA